MSSLFLVVTFVSLLFSSHFFLILLRVLSYHLFSLLSSPMASLSHSFYSNYILLSSFPRSFSIVNYPLFCLCLPCTTEIHKRGYGDRSFHFIQFGLSSLCHCLLSLLQTLFNSLHLSFHSLYSGSRLWWQWKAIIHFTLLFQFLKIILLSFSSFYT